jgi:hypothetical protein
VTTYVFRNGRFVHKQTGKPMAVKNKGIFAPQVMPDTPEYISPVTRKPIVGRAARREDLKRAGCREVDPSEYKPTYISERFKHLNTER